MNNFDSELPEDWEDRGDLAWNEFDWERYLRDQDQAIHRYLGYYELLRTSEERLDAVARKMGWEPASESPDSESEEPQDEALGEMVEFETDDGVYTLHKNPVFIATKAICLSLRRNWELEAANAQRIPPMISLPYLTCINRAEDTATQAIYALDFGDYAMAVSLFKRALSAVNDSLAILNRDANERYPAIVEYSDDARRQLFDLREIWLRIVSDCRSELDRPVDDENDTRS